MPTTFDGFARHLPTHFFRFFVKASYGFVYTNPKDFHFGLLGIPKTFCVVALEMKNKSAKKNRAHLYIMFMLRAKIEKNLAQKFGGSCRCVKFFQTVKSKIC